MTHCCCCPFKILGEFVWLVIWIYILTVILKIYFFGPENTEEWIHALYRYQDEGFLTTLIVVSSFLMTVFILRWGWKGWEKIRECRRDRYVKV